MTEQTGRLRLPLIVTGQAQKDVTHNAALSRIDRLCPLVVAEPPRASPPPAPAANVSWIVATGATAAWAGQEAAIATWTGLDWEFLPPFEGLACWITTPGGPAVFSGGAWQADRFPVSGLTVRGKPMLGAPRADVAEPAGGSTIDVEARASLAALISYLRLQGVLGD
jgi:hypothetical protein